VTAQRPVQILYFAWLRERVGVDQESVELPAGVGDVAGLVAMLRARSPRHALAFASGSTVRCAVNQEFAEPGAPVAAGDEVAFFPPVTGG
jgi:molybdopterin synthase sulfur carrier subunit